MFVGPSREAAAAILISECGANLAFHRNATPESLDRIRFAVLKLGDGDLGKLRDAVKLAQQDWRDALMAAGFGDVKAHEGWFPDGHAA